jgi:pentatricopeptide repeat protein
LHTQWQKILEGVQEPVIWLSLGASAKNSAKAAIALPDSVWSLFMTAFLELDRPDYSQKVWDTQTSFKITPSIRTWNALLRASCRHRSLTEASMVWREMNKKKMEPEMESYDALFQAFWKAGRQKDALALFEDLRNASLKYGHLSTNALRPLCHSALQCFLEVKQVKEAQTLLANMIEYGPPPQPSTYNIFLQSYKLKGDLRKIADTLRDMSAAGVEPDPASFTIVLDVLMLKENNKDAVDKLMMLMKALGIEPNAATWTTLMHHLLQGGDLVCLQHASNLLIQMESNRNKELGPNEVTYTQLIHAYLSCDQLSPPEACIAADELIRRMERRKLKPNQITYEVLIKGAFRNNDTKLAMKYFEQQRRAHVPFGHNTLDILLTNLLRLKDFASAELVKTEIAHQGYELQIDTDDWP